MKYLTLLLVPLFAFASGATMSPMEHSSLHTDKINSTLKTQQKMNKLRNLGRDEVINIVKNETSEEVTSLKLTHIGNYLLYKVTTPKYKLQVNALDGSVIKKESLNI
jgi:uncharacterized membrane protein YkoI